MWVRGVAIRPVPSYAVIDRGVLERVERELADDCDEARAELDEAFARFEHTQPHLADRVTSVLARPLDETALALGYFLVIAIWLAFERRFEVRLGEVTRDALEATDAAVALEEELRANHVEEPLDLDDVIALEQPGVLTFVHEHVEAALDTTSVRDEADVDVDDVDQIYRTILVLILALSHAVVPESGASAPSGEMLA